ncbi:hypothetical protein B0T21DRAFT_39135 [Apiosordaria backusii]|uniref:Uncharacterized protein n=1 Tax=Apiosordaria backusii TaxID=314023 RepID=A0AA40AX74_9PEZI|nr:hypothetical protein B0T21DRAFT_39135 [Apiosordaria backusii]
MSSNHKTRRRSPGRLISPGYAISNYQRTSSRSPPLRHWENGHKLLTLNPNHIPWTGYRDLDLHTEVDPAIRATYERNRRAARASTSHIFTPYDPSSSGAPPPSRPAKHVFDYDWSPSPAWNYTSDNLSEYYPSRASLYGSTSSTSNHDLLTLHDDRVSCHSDEIPIRIGHPTSSEQLELHKWTQEKGDQASASGPGPAGERGRTSKRGLTEAEQRVYIQRSRIAPDESYDHARREGSYQRERSRSR